MPTFSNLELCEDNFPGDTVDGNLVPGGSCVALISGELPLPGRWQTQAENETMATSSWPGNGVKRSQEYAPASLEKCDFNFASQALLRRWNQAWACVPRFQIWSQRAG